MAGLRDVRVGEEVRVKLGEHAGKSGKALDVGKVFAVVEVDNSGDTSGDPYRSEQIIVKLTDMVRLVTSKIDAEIDSPLAAEKFDRLGAELENLDDEIDVAILKAAEEASKKLGLPGEIARALGFLPYVKNIVFPNKKDGAVVMQIAEGLITAAGVLGVGEELIKKIRPLVEDLTD